MQSALESLITLHGVDRDLLAMAVRQMRHGSEALISGGEVQAREFRVQCRSTIARASEGDVTLEAALLVFVAIEAARPTQTAL
jgi:hypothetical protein